MLNSMQASSEAGEVIKQPASRHYGFAQPAVVDLKRKSVIGDAAVSAQGVKFFLQMATMMVLARLLSPKDFGLQGMVVVVIGFLALFREAGLGLATVQRPEVTHEQTSTLFWINVAVGAILASLCQRRPRSWSRSTTSPSYTGSRWSRERRSCSNGLAAQHGALLKRDMRFLTQAKIDVAGLAVGCATGIVMASLGCRYWSLVGMAVASSIVGAAGVWLAVPWVPGPPRRRSGIRSMLHFGGLATCVSFLVSGVEYGQAAPGSLLGSGRTRNVWASVPTRRLACTTIERCGHRRGHPCIFADPA